jgi:acyl-CoA synthetase (AMP-forming)/AMP-acid ligase II
MPGPLPEPLPKRTNETCPQPTGTLHFVDRLGDTYRWHSENVSTNEVADTLGSFPQIAETNVYGVLVPHADGRAGCAAIVPTADVKPDLSNFDLAALAEHALSRMPRYAVPIWVRVVRELEYTGTMKLQKGRLRGEGVDPAVVALTGDRLFWLRPGGRAYEPFGEKEWTEVKEGRVRL